MKRNKTLLFFLILLLGSCISRNCSHEQDIRNYSVQLDSVYKIKNLCDHFPNHIKNEPNAMLNIVWPSEAAISEIYLSRHCTISQASDVLANYKIVNKYQFSDSTNFLMSIGWMWDSTIFAKHVNLPVENTKLPIPQFEDMNFGTKTITYSENVDGTDFLYEKQIPPDDLVVYVIDAQHGDFWKTNKNPRPALLKEWKNGYSRGFAFSETSELFIYWLIVW